MTKVTRIDPASMNELRAAFDAALAEVGKKFGVCLTTGRGMYARDLKSGHLKVEILLGGSDEELADSARTTFESAARHSFGMIDPAWYGQRVVLNGTAFTVSGVNPRARKNDIQIKRVSDGAVMVTSSDTIRRKLPEVPAVSSKTLDPKAKVKMMPVKEFTRIANAWEIPAWWRGQVVSFGINALVIVSLDENTESDEWIMASDALGNSKAFTYAEVAAQLGE